jgi:hypothetical protein
MTTGKERDPNERLRQQETAMRDGRDSRLAPMTAAAYGDFPGRRWQQMTIALIDDGTQELVADNDGEGTRVFDIY